ncbi:MAG: serine hydrolase domain-containing protein [Pseudomonadota bacterium]
MAKVTEAAPHYALGVAVSQPDRQSSTYTFGPVHKGAAVDVAPDAAWHIGSISKSFTATLVMQRVDIGDLDLDTPIGTYLSDNSMDQSWQALTLRQLLSHTAGLPANPGINAMRIRDTENLHSVRHGVLSAMWHKPVTPGTFKYSNVGYVLAGYILETSTGKTWEEQIKDEIAVPLGLTSLGFGAPSGAATPWGHRNFILVKRPVPADSAGSDNPAWIGPAGTIHMTLADLLAWGQAHVAACAGDNPTLLSQDSCREMQTIVSDNYGLGWVVMDDGRVWHNGSNTMWYAVLSMDMEKQKVVAVTTNVAQMGPIDALVRDLHDIP